MKAAEVRDGGIGTYPNTGNSWLCLSLRFAG